MEHCESTETSESVESANLRTSLARAGRKKHGARYEAKKEKGFSKDEAEKLNAHYDWLYDDGTLDRYQERPFVDAASGRYADRASRALFDGAEWYIYKVTAPIRPGRDLAVQRFLNRYVAPQSFDWPTSIGCNNTHVSASYKVNFTNDGMANNQLHFVNGPKLHGSETAASWIAAILDVTLGSAEGRGPGNPAYSSTNASFNAFMHNKVQMYAPDVSGFEKALRRDEVATIRRSSEISVDGSDETTQLAHLLIPMEGRGYEIVGPLASLDAASRDAFTPWVDSECAASSSFSESLASLDERYRASENTTVWYDTDDRAKLDGRPQPMLTQIHVAKAASADTRPALSHLGDFTTATVETRSLSSDCSVSSATWATMPGVVVKYVQNSHADLPAKELLEDYEAAVRATHDAYFSSDDNSIDAFPAEAGWDAFLDQHVGLMTNSLSDVGETGGMAVMAEALRGAGVAYGARNESGGIHYYSGYGGTMAWEYNLGFLSDTSHEFGDICACVPENNKDVFMRRTGDSNCTYEPIGRSESKQHGPNA